MSVVKLRKSENNARKKRPLKRIATAAAEARDKFNAFTGLELKMLENSEALVEGCKGVAVYDENIIVLKGKRFNLQFMGLNLILKNLNPESILIVGRIDSVTFIEK